MAEALLVLFGSPDDERATVGAMLLARGLDNLETCSQFAVSYAKLLRDG